MSKFESILGHDCGLESEVMPIKLRELMDTALSHGALGRYRFLVLGKDGSKMVVGSITEKNGYLVFGPQEPMRSIPELWELKETNHDLELIDDQDRPLKYVKTVRVAKTVILKVG